MLSIGPLGTNFNEISIGIQTFSFKKMHFKMASAKWRPFCLGLNVLIWFYVIIYCVIWIYWDLTVTSLNTIWKQYVQICADMCCSKVQKCCLECVYQVLHLILFFVCSQWIMIVHQNQYTKSMSTLWWNPNCVRYSGKLNSIYCFERYCMYNKPSEIGAIC